MSLGFAPVGGLEGLVVVAAGELDCVLMTLLVVFDPEAYDMVVARKLLTADVVASSTVVSGVSVVEEMLVRLVCRVATPCGC